jgi:hypothetical protein
MANSSQPPPPLPFGSSANLPKALAAPFSGNVSFAEDLATVRDVTSLVGVQIFDQMSATGDIGAQAESGHIAADGMTRQPWILTCQSWIDTQRYLIARVNPSEVQWRMPQRSAVQKTRIGEILHVWRDRFRGTYYDEPQLTITFQSGNVMAMREKPLIFDPNNPQLVPTNQFERGARSLLGEISGAIAGANSPQFKSVPGLKPDPSETEPNVPDGLHNFYQFLALVDEQKILNSGDINYCYIVYNSRLFPNLTLAGLFTPDGVSWSDSANDPNQVSNWSANFTIYDSYPRLNDLNTLETFFRSAGFGRF